MYDKQAFTFNDISLVPQYSDVERGEIDITTNFCGYSMKVPVISSPMMDVTNFTVVQKMRELGAIGIHHRYDYEKARDGILRSAREKGGIAVSPSMPTAFLKECLEVNPEQIAVIDVAHGHTQRNLDFANLLIDLGYKHIVSGNIVTIEAALAYIHVGVNILRIGVGSGYACTTRTNIGVGVPQAYAVNEIWKSLHAYNKSGITLISDGGHRTTGDIVKALALGADYVMLGSMLAGCNESPNGTTYRGMASEEAQRARGKQNFVVEGVAKQVERKGSLESVLNKIKDNIEQACYYMGARNLDELKLSDWIFVSNHGYQEGLA